MRGGTIPLSFDDIKFGTDIAISDGVNAAAIAVDIPVPADPADQNGFVYTDAEKAAAMNTAATAIITAIDAAGNAPFTVSYTGTAAVMGELKIQYADTYKLDPDADALLAGTEFRLPPAVKPIFSTTTKAVAAAAAATLNGGGADVPVGTVAALNSQLNDALMAADDDGILSDFIQPENLAVALNNKLSNTAGFEDVEVSWDYARVGWRVQQSGDDVGQINFSSLNQAGAGTAADPYTYTVADATTVNPLWGAGGGTVPCSI